MSDSQDGESHIRELIMYWTVFTSGPNQSLSRDVRESQGACHTRELAIQASESYNGGNHMEE